MRTRRTICFSCAYLLNRHPDGDSRSNLVNGAVTVAAAAVTGCAVEVARTIEEQAGSRLRSVTGALKGVHDGFLPGATALRRELVDDTTETCVAAYAAGSGGSVEISAGINNRRSHGVSAVAA